MGRLRFLLVQDTTPVGHAAGHGGLLLGHEVALGKSLRERVTLGDQVGAVRSSLAELRGHAGREIAPVAAVDVAKGVGVVERAVRVGGKAVVGIPCRHDRAEMNAVGGEEGQFHPNPLRLRAATWPVVLVGVAAVPEAVRKDEQDHGGVAVAVGHQYVVFRPLLIERPGKRVEMVVARGRGDIEGQESGAVRDSAVVGISDDERALARDAAPVDPAGAEDVHPLPGVVDPGIAPLGPRQELVR